MTAQSSHSTNDSTGKRRVTRAERRADARTQTRKHRRDRGQRTIPTTQLIGGLATILVVLGIITYAIAHANGLGQPVRHSSGPALTNPKDLNPAAAMLLAGRAAPDFTLKGVDGGTYSLAAQHGHPVLLEFFAVWCPHCQHEAPIIERLEQGYAARGVRIWSILANPYGPNYDASFGQDLTPATKADLLWFSRTFGEHVPQLVDPNFHVVNEYGVSGYPGIFIVDKQGTIVYSQSGDQSYGQLAGALNQALNGS